jgi:hypothetical protein
VAALSGLGAALVASAAAWGNAFPVMAPPAAMTFIIRLRHAAS